MFKRIIKLIKKIFKRHNYLFYLGSTDMLPPPLSKEEEIRLVGESNNGSMEARNKLIEHNLRLVVFLAKRYENTKVDLEDLVSIGTIGLIKGVNTYKLDKNIKLATYASRCIDNEILMYLRKTKKKRTEISFEDSLSFDADGNELHLEDVLGTESDIVTKGLDDELDKNMMLREIEKLSIFKRSEYCENAVFELVNLLNKNSDYIYDVYSILSEKYIYDEYSLRDDYKSEYEILSNIWKLAKNGENEKTTHR